MEKSGCRVCVTGGSGYIASWLIRKLLAKFYTVHATLRNLEDESKVGLMSLPNADTNLVLFQADIYNTQEIECTIKGCEYVFHVAVPFPFDATKDQLQDYPESVAASTRSVAESCIRSGTVKRLIYTGSVGALSPINQDGSGYKSTVLDESSWTPHALAISSTNDFMLAHTKSKTLAEKEVLRYNETKSSDLEVVSLACGLVAGETLLPYAPLSVQMVLSQLKGDPRLYLGLQFLNELLGTVPLVHVEDVSEALVFCAEKPSMRGRFLCAAASVTPTELANHIQDNYPDFKIPEEYLGELERETIMSIDNTRLKEMGFEYGHDLKGIIRDSVDCGRRLGALSSVIHPERSITTPYE